MRKFEQEYPYLYGSSRHHIPNRMLIWILSGAFGGLAAGMLITHLTKHLFHIRLYEEKAILIYAVTICIMVCLFTVIGWLFRDHATANKKDADMRYESVPKWKRLLIETLTLLVLNGGAAALMWFLLQAEDRTAG